MLIGAISISRTTEWIRAHRGALSVCRIVRPPSRHGTPALIWGGSADRPALLCSAPWPETLLRPVAPVETAPGDEVAMLLRRSPLAHLKRRPDGLVWDPRSDSAAAIGGEGGGSRFPRQPHRPIPCSNGCCPYVAREIYATNPETGLAICRRAFSRIVAWSARFS